MAGEGTIAGYGMGLLGMIGGHQQERRNYRNQREMMQKQYENQLGLNVQGHDLQMDMWNKTNYGAQVDHMREAGLNPALMYGSAGQGGTTGSQTGGSAAMGSSQQGRVMDMSNMLTLAQIKAIDEGVEKSKWERGEKGEAEINEINVRASLGEAKINLTNEQINQVTASANKLIADTNLTEKIQEMDYGGQLGKNVSQNILDILTGNAGISGWDYLQIAAGIASLTYLRSVKLVGQGAAKIKQGIKGAGAKLKDALNKVKKPKKGPIDYTKGYRMDRQSAWDEISRKRNMGVNK